MASRAKTQKDTVLRPGDHVTWDTSQGETEGTVEKRLTHETKIKGHVAHPTEDDPEYLVRSNKTGAKAAHRPQELRKKSRTG